MCKGQEVQERIVSAVRERIVCMLVQLQSLQETYPQLWDYPENFLDKLSALHIFKIHFQEEFSNQLVSTLRLKWLPKTTQ